MIHPSHQHKDYENIVKGLLAKGFRQVSMNELGLERSTISPDFYESPKGELKYVNKVTGAIEDCNWEDYKTPQP